MLIALMAQISTDIQQRVDCLRPLIKAERKQDDAARASRKKAGNVPVLEPDDDQLPLGVPTDFKPQLVVLSYRISDEGRISDCNVDQASSIVAFNTASCDLLRRHYRITPGSQSSKDGKIAVNWTPPAIIAERRQCNNNGATLPISSDQWITEDVFAGKLESGSGHFILDVSATGQITRCTVVAADVSKTLQKSLCSMVLKRAVVLPATDERGTFISGRLMFVVRFVLV